MFGQVPLLELGGQCLVQSAAITRHIADRHGLYACRGEGRVHCDVVAEGAADFYNSFVPLPFVRDPSARETAIEQRRRDIIPRYLAIFEGLLWEGAGLGAAGTWVASGDTPSYADACLYAAIEWAVEISPGVLEAEAYSALRAWRQAFAALPGVTRFLASPHHFAFPTDAYVAEVDAALGR